MKKIAISLLSLGILSIFFGVFFTNSLESNKAVDTISNVLNYRAEVCVYKNGELWECNHNLLYNFGRNMTRDCLTGGCGPITRISLCNSTALEKCTTITAGQTETYTDYESCGLSAATGTYVKNVPNGNWSVSTKFTATCDNLEINATRLGNATPYNFSGSQFTEVTLQTNDELTINWTIGIS